MILKHIKINIFEIFIILLNISMFHTLIPSILFGNLAWYYHQLIIVLVNIIYLGWNAKNIVINIPKITSTTNYLVIILFAIYILEIPRYLINGSEGRNIFLTLLNASSLLSFALILNFVFYKLKNVMSSKEALVYIIKPYVYAVVVIALLSDIVFFLSKMNLIDLFTNPISSGFSFYLDNNAESGTRYFSPLYLTIISADIRGSNFFMDTALFSGISYEPHIATYIMTPALFFIYGMENISKKKKYIFSLILFIFFLTASSLTNLLVLLILGVIYLLSVFIVEKKVFTSLIIILILFFVSLTTSLDELGFDNILLKLSDTGGSKDYSSNFINYVLSPKTIWGDGAFNIPYPYVNLDNIGFVFSLLIVLFYLIGYFSSLKMIVQNKIIVKYIGFASLYFFLHSLKIVQMIFYYPFTVFIVFILIKAYDISRVNDK